MKQIKHNHIALFVVFTLFLASAFMILSTHTPNITGAASGQANVTVINLAG